MVGEQEVAGVRGPANAPTRSWSDVRTDALCGAAGGVGVLAVLLAALWIVSTFWERMEARITRELGR